MMRNTSHFSKLYLALLLFLSGAAGLAYEVVWLRSVANCTGSSAAATAITLSVFMAGMAMGSLVMGRWADRVRWPLRLYAVLELALGCWAVVLPWLLGKVPAVDSLLPEGTSAAIALLARVLLSASLLWVPAFLMGGTLPAIAAHLAATRRADEGRGLSVLYGVQILGAAGGCLLASFVLIGAFGLAGTSRLGAAANLLVAVGCWFLARPRGEQPAGRSPLDDPSSPGYPALCSLPSGALLAGTAFATGFLLLGSEVVFVRTLAMALSAKVHSFALMLATYLVGLSIGSFLASRIPLRWVKSGIPLALATLLGAVGLLWARQVPLERAAPLLVAMMDDGVVERAEYLWLCVELSVLSLLPVAVPIGVAFPLLMRVASARAEAGRSVGQLFFFNTLGSVLGPLITLFVLVPWLGLLGVLYVFAAGCAVLAVVWFFPAISFRHGIPAAAGALAATAGLALCFASLRPTFGGTPRLDCSLYGEAMLGNLPEPMILAHTEGATGTVTVIQRLGARPTLRLDGFEAAGVPGAGTQKYQYMRMMAHLPMLSRGPREVQRALVICCGTGTTAGGLTEYPLEQLDLVDIHPEVLEQLPYFAAHNRNLATNPRCRKIADDGRAQLRRVRDYYDVVTLEPMPPQHAGMTNLYSLEFYQDCHDALREDGVVCQWLPYHLVSREQALAITKAMAEVFPCVQVWEHHQTGILLGSRSEALPLDPRHLQEAMALPGVRADLEAAQVTTIEAWAAGFLCHGSDLRADFDGVDPILDDRPNLEYGEVGFGLSAYSLAESAAIREPFFRACLQASLPLANLDPRQAERLRVRWRATALARYGAYLRQSGTAAQALSLLEDALRERPALQGIPVFQTALNRARADR